MKKRLSFYLTAAALGSVIVLAQTLPPTLPSNSRGWAGWHGSGPDLGAELRTFQIDGTEFRAFLTHRDILAGPEWAPSAPLPLSFDKVEAISREELGKLVGDDRTWRLASYQLNHFAGSNQSRWYYAVYFESAIALSGSSHDTATILLTLAGKPGTIAHTQRP